MSTPIGYWFGEDHIPAMTGVHTVSCTNSVRHWFKPVPYRLQLCLYPRVCPEWTTTKSLALEPKFSMPIMTNLSMEISEVSPWSYQLSMFLGVMISWPVSTSSYHLILSCKDPVPIVYHVSLCPFSGQFTSSGLFFICTLVHLNNTKQTNFLSLISLAFLHHML